MNGNNVVDKKQERPPSISEEEVESNPSPTPPETKEIIDDESGKRINWSNGIEFLMSCISMSVGLGNIWRFPFTAYENGGGAFLIPYLVVLFVIGKPMYYLEMILGTFTSRSSVKVWSISPLFVGIGIGQLCGSFAIVSYYTSLLSLTLYYLGVSFQSVLPWSFCRDEWGPTCVDSQPSARNISKFAKNLQSSSELYFVKGVLDEKEDISDGLGVPNWRLTITLFVSWVVIFLVIMRGVKSSGKASYFLALFPYVVLIALLVRAVTLEGAADGIVFFLKPDWGQLANLNVWKEAVVQCFFSLTLCQGPLITFSSYNRFDHNIYRDALIVTSLDTVTSMLAGVIMFGILGNLAHNLHIDNISDVVRSGTGLAFISYPDAIAKFQLVPQVFSVLFFFMLFVLGVGSAVALESAIVSAVIDHFGVKRFWTVALGCSVVGFFSSLVYLTPGGQWILGLVDHFGGTYTIFILAIFEMTGIFWLYGLQNFCDDVEFMTKRRVGFYWRFCWVFLTPVLMAVIFIYSMVNLRPLQYSGWDYPQSAMIAGWLLLAIGVFQFPLWAFITFASNYEFSLCKTFKQLTRPSAEWGPADSQIRRDWILFKLERQEQRRIEAENSKLSYFTQKVYNFFGKSV